MLASSDRIKPAVSVLALLFGLFFATGCSTFEKEWRTSAASGAGNAPGLEGRWTGSWLSDRNAHTGKLRCVVTPCGDNQYRAHFDARYWRIFRYRYPVNLRVSQQGEIQSFQGTADLGTLAGGVYEYTGTLKGDNFEAKYKSKYDHGTFQMKKLER